MTLPSLPDVPRERRRTATVVAVGAFAVLCLLALVLGLKGLFAPAESSILTSVPPPQPSSSASAAAGTSSTAAAPSPSATAQASDDRVGFSSPSGNIRCEISSQGARCDIADHSWTAPAKPASCTGAWGDALQVTAQQASFACTSAAPVDGKALGYGSSVSRGDFRCDSDKDGVTCVHRPSRHAFSVARAAYHLR
ncbi:hypothetical protein [Angustibacter sp. Root456]|uniref:hypothetical protein n=1 Tax=Angustibacter sp. Root456 TaxID=1736539 RepID=UPI0006FC2681|nr:hypothetical protein [Angustibacter sp. Root456]KQX65641.1 hypothetical protein ASD06_08385 [Angustibacter sp. Root456]